MKKKPISLNKSCHLPPNQKKDFHRGDTFLFMKNPKKTDLQQLKTRKNIKINYLNAWQYKGRIVCLQEYILQQRTEGRR